MNNNTVDTMVDKINMMPEITYRGFEGEADYPKILDVYLRSAAYDGLEPSATLDDIINLYTHLHHSEPAKDLLLAEAQGTPVGYCRLWWEVEGSGQWVGFQFGDVVPEWRHRGIGSTMLGFCEKRFQQIASGLKQDGQLPIDAPCAMDTFAHDSEVDKIKLFESSGYQVVRHAFDMVRPDLEHIPQLPLPDGVEVRPVIMEQLRQILDASNEAFQDHWGYIPDPWEFFEQMINDADFDPSLYRVAWQGDQVAGMVLSFINKDENEVYGRKRGYTENICVRRPWRKQGLAKALIARSLLAFRERGMTEAALGVDAENISGALQLYQSMGYQVVTRMGIFRKRLNV